MSSLAPEGPPAPPKNVSAALARLNAAAEEIEELKEKAAASRREVAQVLKALHLENSTLRAELTALHQCTEILETAVGLDMEGEGGGTEDGGDVEGNAGGGEAEASRDEQAKIAKSIALVNSQAIQSRSVEGRRTQ